MQLTPEERHRIIERELARVTAKRRARRKARLKYTAWACLGCLALIVVTAVALRFLTGLYPWGRTTTRATVTAYPTYTPYPTLKLRAALELTATPHATYTPLPTYTPYPTNTPLATYTPYPTNTSQPTYTLLPTATLVPPTHTPLPAVVPPPSPASVAQSWTTERDFKAYLQKRYSSIAGQSLDIEDIFIGNEEAYGDKWVTIELTRDSALYVFAKQTQADALEYGTSLLKDVIGYFDGQDCAAYVSDNYYTFHLSDYHFDDDWYYIGDFDLDDGWYISKDYVKAHFRDGFERVEVWNYR